jgi:hypothetical protein
MFVMACAALIVKAFRGIPALDDGKVDVKDSKPGLPYSSLAYKPLG